MDLTNVIKKAIEKDGRSLYAIAKDAEVAYSVLHRFVTGDRTVNLDTASKIAAALGLEVRKKTRK